VRAKSLKALFSRDRERAAKFTLTAGDLTLDYSKNHVNATTRKLLVKLAKEAQVAAAIEAMFAGERINVTENRSVLHAALRAKMSDKVALDVGGVLEVWEALNMIEDFVERVDGHRQHRHRRFGPWAGDGGPRATALLARKDALSQRVEHRWHPACGFDAGAQPGVDPVRCLL
jgi:glucose-6-phosphate isomerase